MEVSNVQIFLFMAIIFLFFLGMALLAYMSYRLSRNDRCLSPYSGLPMRRGEDIPLHSVEKIMKFLYYQAKGYDNRVFLMRKAMVCRETGRIFPNTISWWGHATVDWSFLQKRYPGQPSFWSGSFFWSKPYAANYVSWGSLTPLQQQEIRKLHTSLEGFQTDSSCPNPSPRAVEERYIYAKPGPLYVDLKTNILLGWKSVPDSPFEVLVVQKPIVRPIQTLYNPQESE